MVRLRLLVRPVGGATYVSMRIRYGQIGSPTRKHAERVIAGYAAGTPLLVFYDPQKPADALLVRGTSRRNITIAPGGLVFPLPAFLVHIND